MTQLYTLLLFAGFNNYYNRQVKRYEYIEEYPDPILTLSNVNFNYNDGIEAEAYLNLANMVFSGEPDYMLAIDGTTGIITRWFVMDTARTRNGQSHLTLRRDLVADFYNEALDSPCFIEKATLGLNNDLIFNSEAMTYNQIKQGEFALTDKTAIPWIVGYVAQDVAKDGDISVTGKMNAISPDGVLESWSAYEYYEWFSNDYYGDYTDLTFALGTTYSNGANIIYSFDENGNAKTPKSPSGWAQSQSIPREGVQRTYSGYPGGWYQNSTANVGYYNRINPITAKAQEYSNWRTLSYSYTKAHDATEISLIANEDGKIYRIGDKYFQVHFQLLGESSTQWAYNISTTSGLGLQFKACAESATISTNRVDTSNYPCNILYTCPIYNLWYEEIQAEPLTTIIRKERTHTTDSAYDMFCMPYGAFTAHYQGYDRQFNSPEAMMATASAIATTLGQGLYDLQLLPYCPLNKQVIGVDGKIYLTQLRADAWEEVKETGDYPLGILFWCDKTNFTTELIDPELPELPTDNIEFKVQHETEFYRMVSPNYNGTFEIKATSNRGLSGFTATCSYKPFTPYIKVAPNFGGLYGGSFGDARGLICGGDFSLSIVSDAWKNYQIQNKNYQVMFDRQITNMEFNNNIAIAQGALSAVTGAVSAGVMGGAVGGPVGGIGLGATSLAMGIADVGILMAQQKETLDYTKDQFGYQLGNIKALPQSLTKVSSYNADNKVFPFLEFYSCSEVEKEALRKKIQYNGMTTMTVGTMREYLLDEETYIKGKIIRIENTDIDYHLLLELATEIQRGVFIK